MNQAWHHNGVVAESRCRSNPPLPPLVLISWNRLAMSAKIAAKEMGIGRKRARRGGNEGEEEEDDDDDEGEGEETSSQRPSRSSSSPGKGAAADVLKVLGASMDS